MAKKAPAGKFEIKKDVETIAQKWHDKLMLKVDAEKKPPTLAREKLDGDAADAYGKGVCRFFVAKGFITPDKMDECKSKVSVTNEKWKQRTKDGLEGKDENWANGVKACSLGYISNRIGGGLRNAMKTITDDYEYWLNSVLSGMYASLSTGVHSRKGKKSANKKKERKEEIKKAKEKARREGKQFPTKTETKAGS